MVMVALGDLIGPPPPCLDGGLGRVSRDQAVAPVPAEVALTRLEQGLPHHEVVLGLEELHQRPLHLPVAQPSCDVNLLARQRVQSGVIHARGDIRGHLDRVQHTVATTGP